MPTITGVTGTISCGGPAKETDITSIASRLIANSEAARAVEGKSIVSVETLKVASDAASIWEELYPNIATIYAYEKGERRHFIFSCAVFNSCYRGMLNY